MIIRTLLSSGLLLGLAAAPLTAASHAPAERDHERKLSDQGMAAITQYLEQHPKLFAAVDRDGDGVLSRGEVVSARARIAHHRRDGEHGRVDRAALKERFDTDGDGTLSAEERAAAKERLAHHRRDGEHGRVDRAALKERFDTDGDGTLSDQERAAARAAMEARLAERSAKLKSERPELFAKIDRDGDGELSVEELRRAKAAHRRHRAGGDGGERRGAAIDRRGR